MSFYDVFMSPFEFFWLGKIRKEYIQKAKGKVLEIGFGSGVNYKYYDLEKIESITAADIFKSDISLPKLTFKTCSVTSLLFSDNSFDTVVLTLVLCSVEEVDKALSEIERVLKSSGKLIFIEHIRPKNKLGNFFDKFNTVWRHNSFGCQMNKNTYDNINKTNLKIKGKVYAQVLCYGTGEKL